MSRKLVLLFALAFVAAAAVLACTGSPALPDPSPTPDLTAAEIAQRATEAMLAIRSLHYEIDVEGVHHYIDSPPTTALKHVEGDLLRPDKVRGVMRVNTLGITTDVGFIGIGGLSYITNPLSQRWETLPPEWGWQFDPRLPFDQEVGIPAIVSQVTLDRLGLESLGDRPAYRLHGTALAQEVMRWQAGPAGAGDVLVEVWIDSETFLLHRVRLTELGSDPERPRTWEIAFSQFDEPVQIATPPVAPS
ncbi:MAG: LppX_LprAFG lipoprotein [Anaerolineae bacterium]